VLAEICYWKHWGSITREVTWVSHCCFGLHILADVHLNVLSLVFFFILYYEVIVYGYTGIQIFSTSLVPSDTLVLLEQNVQEFVVYTFTYILVLVCIILNSNDVNLVCA